MADKRIALLVNPLSGKGKAAETGKWLSHKLTERKIQHSLFMGSWPAEATGFTQIWLIGGDGTINYFLNHYNYYHLPIVLFKGGTGNDFAWMLYGDINREQQLDLVLNTLPRKVDAGSCNGQYYVNSCGIGFDGEVLRSIHAIRMLGGHLGYLYVVLRKIFSYREALFKITASGKTFHDKYLLVIINNSRRTGGGFLVTPDARVNDGRLNFLLCKKLSILKRLRYLPVIEKGRHLHLPFITHSEETEITIKCESSLYAQLDGELISGKTFSLKVHPGMLSVIY